MKSRKKSADETHMNLFSANSRPKTSMQSALESTRLDRFPTSSVYTQPLIFTSYQQNYAPLAKHVMLAMQELDWASWNTSIDAASSSSKNPATSWQPGLPAPTSSGEHDATRTSSSSCKASAKKTRRP